MLKRTFIFFLAIIALTACKADSKKFIHGTGNSDEFFLGKAFMEGSYYDINYIDITRQNNKKYYDVTLSSVNTDKSHFDIGFRVLDLKGMSAALNAAANPSVNFNHVEYPGEIWKCSSYVSECVQAMGDSVRVERQPYGSVHISNGYQTNDFRISVNLTFDNAKVFASLLTQAYDELD